MSKLRAGEWVEVRSKEEILRTLDKNGRLEELPFMPQMFQYCGKRFKVFKRAHKTCDTINDTGGRRLSNGIHLDLRCDGKAYGGCQAGCLIFWKDAWLKPLVENTRSAESLREKKQSLDEVGCSEEDVKRGTEARDRQGGDEIRYICQATQLPYCTTPLRWWDMRQYLEDYTSGNATLGRIFRGFLYISYYHLAQAWRHGPAGRPSRWLYDRFQAVWGGPPFPRRMGTLSAGQSAPTVSLNLQPGELVRVKSYNEILATLNGMSNRGLAFDAELVPYCGGTYRVKTRVKDFIDEKTGRMSSLKTPAVILEGVWCRSRYSNCKMFCPRSIYSWWREVWLERSEQTHGRGQPAQQEGQCLPSQLTGNS